MSSLKCAQCGLVSFASQVACRRCGATLVRSATPGQNVAYVNTSVPHGIVLEDGYVLPPPPSVGMPGSGVWRHQSKLVMSKGAVLPDRCVKCDEPAFGGRLKRKLTWHHPAIYLLLLIAALIYIIVAMILRKTATVEIGLCERHRAKRRKNIWITWALFLLCVAGFVIAVIAQDATYALAGLVFLIGAIIFAILTVKVVTASKIDDNFVWLKGVNRDYLNQLPQWPGA